jgi:hypothetical protein
MKVAIFLKLHHIICMKTKKPLIILAAAAAVLLSSCTVTQNITLNAAKGGTGQVQLDTTDYFKALIVDLTSFDDKVSNSDKDPDTIILDNSIGTLWTNLEKSSSTSSVHFYRTPAPEKSYIGNIVFTDLPALIRDLGSKASAEDIASLFTISKNSLQLRIGMDNYHVLAELVPFLKEENFEAYGPVYNHGYSEDDYLEMMDFILGDDTSSNIMESEVYLYFEVPGTITSISENGTMITDSAVQFGIPLIKLLLLNEDIKVSCSWK